MKSKKKLALLGGDLRQLVAARRLSALGWSLKIWGLERLENLTEDPVRGCTVEETVEGAGAVILPLPASSDGFLLNCPFSEEEGAPSLVEIFSKLASGCVIVGGRIPREAVASAEAMGLRVVDYFDSEPFQIHNAYTTAEAALSIAMNRLEKNIRDARVAIAGFGRIAKHLVGILLPMGAEVTVAARKSADLAWAESIGCRSLRLSAESPDSLAALCHGYDVIYNTVPHWLFERSFLERMDHETFLIDLASVPGGVDICAAKELGCNVLWATSLPGKYAPHSAGEQIAACVDRILREEVESL